MPSRNPRWEQVSNHQRFMCWWGNIGSLYGGADDDPESLAIREECERLGLPMGYGRVRSAPTQLDDLDDARALFRRAR